MEAGVQCMPTKGASQTLKPYQEAIAEFGPGFEATLWTSPEAQIKRFDIMMEMVDFTDQILIDAGCGIGDFAARLIHCAVSYRGYIGLDGLEGMVQTATERDLRQSKFIVADFERQPQVFAAHQPDWICFSGSLNTFTPRQLRVVVGTAFENARCGVVFNVLSNRAHPRYPVKVSPARRMNVVKLLDWALSLSSRVQFRQEYLDGHDGTFVIEKDASVG